MFEGSSQDIFQSLPIPLLRISRDALLTEVNPAFTELLDYAASDIIGRPLSELSPEPFRMSQLHEMTLLGRSVTQFRCRLRNRTGVDIPVTVNTQPVMNNLGTVTGYILSAVPVTAPATAGSPLEQFWELLKPLTLGAVMLDPDARILFINDYLLNLTGWKKEEVVGQDWFDIFVPPETREKVRRVFDTIIRDDTMIPSFENPILTREGKQRLIQWSNAVLRDDAGKIIGTASIGQLVSRRDDTEQALVQTNAVLRAIRAIEQLIVRETDENRLLQGMCDILAETRGYQSLWAMLFTSPEGRQAAVVVQSGQDERFRALERLLKQGIMPYCVARLLAPETSYGVTVEPGLITISNPGSECPDCPLRAAHRDRVNLVVRLTAEQQLIGILGVTLPARRKIGTEEEELLAELAADVAFAVAAIRAAQAHRQALAEKAASEERYQHLFENSPLGIYRTTPSGEILMANPALVQMLGYPSFEELAKRNLEDEGFETRAERARFKQAIEAAGEIRGRETSWKRLDGTPVFVRENARVVRDAQGKVLYYEGTVEDITERKRLEEARRQDEERLRRLTENLRAVNRLALDLAGAPAEVELFGFLAQRLRAIMKARLVAVNEYLPDKRELVLRHIAAEEKDLVEVQRLLGPDIMTFRTPVNDEALQFIRTSTARRLASLTEASFGEIPEALAQEVNRLLNLTGWVGIAFLYKGELIGTAVCGLTSASTMADEEFLQALGHISAVSLRRRRAEDQLRASEARVNSILSAMQDLVFAFDAQGRFSFYHAPETQMLYLPPEQFLGRTPGEVLPPEVAELTAQGLAKNRQGEIAEYEYALTVQNQPRWFQAKLSPLLVGREYAGTVAVVRDITERKQTELVIQELNAQLKQRVQELETAVRELEAFSYSVSHDLRAPLRAIDGFSRILIEDYYDQLQPEGRQHLQRVRENAQHMARLIDDLLALSRYSRQPMRRSRIDPTPLVRRVLEDLRDEQKGREIDIRIQELPPCRADPNLLQQVFFNLLSNALKFTRTRRPAVITIGSLPSEPGGAVQGEVIYFVRDNGVGFDMQYAEKAFGVFQRLHRAEDFEGTGVGLAIVQRIISRHGGRVWAEAEPERGATFYFTIPETREAEEVKK